MNNTFYPDIVYDYVPHNLRGTFKDKSFIIQYTNEITLNEQMEIFSGSTKDGFMVVVKNIDTGKEIFTAVIK